MNKRLVFWLRISLLVAMGGSLFLSAAAFFCVQDVILSYPADLRYPFLWGTVAALSSYFYRFFLQKYLRSLLLRTDGG